VTDLQDALGVYLAHQRWYGGDSPPAVVRIQVDEEIGRLRHLLVDADDATYQLLLAPHDQAFPPEFLHGHAHAHLPSWHDALIDGDASLALLREVTGGAEEAQRARPLGAEQSNSSVVYDERLILKLFRRLTPGPNPDVEVTEALGRVGFPHVAAPVAVWRRDHTDLAVVQPFLVGATDGWSLALTSLRDLLADGPDDPAQAGGDFASEAGRLGLLTAEMHLALAQAFGTEDGDLDAWADGVAAQLALHGVTGGDEVVAALRASGEGGRAIRVHGDFHLGQVLRTDAGWYVLDFEGEPARPLDERMAPASPLKDVTGMLRSFQYAGAVAMTERAEGTNLAKLAAQAERWEARNRSAYMSGYFGVDGISALLPQDARPLLRALELEKAAYELGYERAYRPHWAEIPRAAIDRLLCG
jgi:maltokinase